MAPAAPQSGAMTPTISLNQPDGLAALLARGRTLVMGILNVTPDSFSDGGQFLDPAVAVAHARRMAGEGADILDVGAESTRPYVGAKPVALDDELARLKPVLGEIVQARPAGLDRHHQGQGRGLGARTGRRDPQRRVGPAARSRHGARRGRAWRAGDRDAQPRGRRSGARHHGRREGVLRALARHRGARRHRARAHRARSRHRLRQDGRAEHRDDRAARGTAFIRPAAADGPVAKTLHRQRVAVEAGRTHRRLDRRQRAVRAQRRRHRARA